LNQDSKKKPTSSNDPLSEQWIDLRLIAGMRVVLGTSALLVILIGPLRPLNREMPTYFALVLYSLYGLLIYHLSHGSLRAFFDDTVVRAFSIQGLAYLKIPSTRRLTPTATARKVFDRRSEVALKR